MADKKVEKALYGPSTFEVALGAVLGLLVGVLLACVYLVFKPVQAVKEAPKEPVTGMTYYLAGKTDANKGRGWQGKVSTFVAGGSVIASEEELNAWAASLTPAAAPAAKPAPKPGEKPTDKPADPAKKDAPTSNDFISASGLNFRLEDGKLHIAAKVLLNYYGLSKEVIWQASGSFTRSGDGYVFAPEKVYLGSCPLHAVPGATGALNKVLVAKQSVPDDFRAAWSKITDIAIASGSLTVTTQP